MRRYLKVKRRVTRVVLADRASGTMILVHEVVGAMLRERLDVESYGASYVPSKAGDLAVARLAKGSKMKHLLEMQIEWSRRTFGRGRNTEGLCKHIEKELNEIRKRPDDVTEWIDVVLLGLDGAWRCLAYPKCQFQTFRASLFAAHVAAAWFDKLAVNMLDREWGEPGDGTTPNEHLR